MSIRVLRGFLSAATVSLCLCGSILLSTAARRQAEKPGEVLRVQRSKAAREAAAHGSHEPSLQEILDHLGYSIDTEKEEIRAEWFVRAGRGPVTHRPIAAFGLEKVCTSGYMTRTVGADLRSPLWKVAADHNKQYAPPIMEGGTTRFDPGRAPFALWVATAGFPGETVYTDASWTGRILRFKSDDLHKAHVFPVKRGGKLVPNAYVIGWEYSTNDDDQDIVTLVENVRPSAGPGG